MVAVLRYARYMGCDSQSIYNHVEFCGACKRKLGGSYDSPLLGRTSDTIDALLQETNNDSFGLRVPSERVEYEHWQFCPFCGERFDDEWWRNQPVQNERAIDHYRNPGHHKGDEHEFIGGPDCMVNHWLATTGDEVCWCDPEVEPSILGCTIKHKDVDYETVMAARRSEHEDDWEDDED